MAGSVNMVVLVGRLGKDPETRAFTNGGGVTNLSVATSESWKDKGSGERKELTEWHKVAIFNEKLGEIAAKYLRKGAMVYLQGTLQTRKWTDKDGADRYTTEVVLPKFGGHLTLLESKDGASNGGAREGSSGDSRAASGPSGPTPASIDADEIPW